ncbi:hypothetical protein H2248_007648 [Termitomyces sp. 'cryptogamus']|nr:hypothetical protein H2248_007648 [Termitomyces sp. 'cryptogamus']
MVLCAEEESHLVDDGDQGAPSSAKWLKLVSLHLYYSFGLGRFTYQAFACYDLLNGGQQKLDEYGVWTGDKEQPAADSCTFDVLPASTVSVWTHKGSVKLTSTLVSTLSAAPINPALFSYATNPALSCLMLPIRRSLFLCYQSGALFSYDVDQSATPEIIPRVGPLLLTSLSRSLSRAS